MGTIFLDRHFSPFDILVKNFFQKEEEFTTPNNRIIKNYMMFLKNKHMYI